MKALILVNAYAQEISTRQVQRLTEELKKRDVEVDVKRNDFFPFSVGQKQKSAIYADFCIYLDKDKYVAELLEKSGVRLFNRARAIELCDDKMTTHVALSDCGVPMPETLPGLLCYDKTATLSPALLDNVIKRLGLPVVVKQSYGSLGKGVFLAKTREELAEISDKIKTTAHLFQKYVAESHGRDMRVIVIGGKVVGGIIRQSDGDFRSNIGQGGHAEKTDVPADIADVAVRAAAALNLDYCGIDFLLAKQPLLCEVNSNAFFDAFEAATKINVAALYVDHILKSL